MVKNYKVITLCGSIKFKDEFMRTQRDLILKGNIVLTCDMIGNENDEYQIVLTEEIKAMLGDMHKRKIDMSDAIFVVNVNGYIGSSTKSEIEYAEQNGKEIIYLEPQI